MNAQVDPFPNPENASTSTTFNGVRLSTRTMPARQAARGGDWCEAFVLSDDILALSIGDVRGHGIESFAEMVIIRQALRDAAQLGFDPARILSEAALLVAGDGRDMYVTAIFALLDSRRDTLAFANAGHPPPLLVSAGESRFLEFPKKDLPLGVAPALRASHVVEIPADALLVFYTDGVTERERNVLLGETQLRDAVLFAYEYPDLPSAAVIERQMHMLGSNQDDAAILTARVSPFWRSRRTLRTPSRRRGRAT